MTDRELHPGDDVAALLGLKAKDPTAAPTEPGATELTDDDAELARRYGLSSDDAQRVRGSTWAERCDDAERLAAPNESESIRDRARRHLASQEDVLAQALSGNKREQQAELVRLLHPTEEEG